MIETDAWLLPGDQNHSEASFVPHHAPVSLFSIRERNGFDRWTDSLQGAEGKRVLCIYRRSGHGPCNRTHTRTRATPFRIECLLATIRRSRQESVHPSVGSPLTALQS